MAFLCHNEDQRSLYSFVYSTDVWIHSLAKTIHRIIEMTTSCNRANWIQSSLPISARKKQLENERTSRRTSAWTVKRARKCKERLVSHKSELKDTLGYKERRKKDKEEGTLPVFRRASSVVKWDLWLSKHDSFVPPLKGGINREMEQNYMHAHRRACEQRNAAPRRYDCVVTSIASASGFSSTWPLYRKVVNLSRMQPSTISRS